MACTQSDFYFCLLIDLQSCALLNDLQCWELATLFLTDVPEETSRSGYQPEISPDDIKDIIKEAMHAEGITRRDVPREWEFTSPKDVKDKSKRFFEVKGFAWFACPKRHKYWHKRHKYWPSAHSWCFMDLKTRTICYRDKQKCKKCESKASPEFMEDALEIMAEYAVESFLIRTGRKQLDKDPKSTDTKKTNGGPHDEERCGRCRRLKRSCWKKD